jgi:hypothetical protein
MSNVALSPAVVAAGRVPAFILADAHLAEMPAPLASLTTPARFRHPAPDSALTSGGDHA